MLYRRLALSSLFFAFISLMGCANVTQTIDDVTCVGEVGNPPDGLVELNDKELLNKALGTKGEGKLCKGKVFLATQPVVVYRVWNSEKSYTTFGSWWTFELPKGPKQKYREDNGICPSWSALDRMSSCHIKIGTKVVVGPGQSAKCKKMTYAKSPVNQVFIPNDSRNNVVLIDNCKAGVNWP